MFRLLESRRLASLTALYDAFKKRLHAQGHWMVLNNVLLVILALRVFHSYCGLLDAAAAFVEYLAFGRAWRLGVQSLSEVM